ncbi:hypothetical protein BMF94_3982 [Rhodotorula taiwanensis]|uniref:Uncharacterized protein n=1 Tax=Rhodotorula taiwanensis TaxID=741276 RepID=A0A2S5B895_9BASI|nr:hypothetical protein BMF94_3982 [Rhodotorula taiwanensis]
MNPNERLEHLFRYNVDILDVLTRLANWCSSKGAMIPWRHFERFLVDELADPKDSSHSLATKTSTSPLIALKSELEGISRELNTSRERLKEPRAQSGLTWRGDPELINDVAEILHAHVAKMKEICMVYRGFEKACGEGQASHAHSYELSDFIPPPPAADYGALGASEIADPHASLTRTLDELGSWCTREGVADSWNGFQEYLFKSLQHNDPSSFTIPQWFAVSGLKTRWSTCCKTCWNEDEKSQLAAVLEGVSGHRVRQELHRPRRLKSVYEPQQR